MPNKQLADDLRASRALIEKPGTWLKVRSAEDEYGNPVSCLSPKAARFCALAAVSRVTSAEIARYKAAQFELGRTSTRGLVTALNDDPSTTHADILALFDRAIAAAEA